MDSDDNLHCHCLDNVVRLLMCQVIFIPSKQHVVTLTWQVVGICCCPLLIGLVMWLASLSLGCTMNVGGGQMVVGGDDAGRLIWRVDMHS